MIDSWPGWAAAANQYTGQWLLLDLGEDREITGMAVQGRAAPYQQWVTSFTIDYWMDGETIADAKNVDSGKPGSVFDDYSAFNDFGLTASIWSFLMLSE